MAERRHVHRPRQPLERRGQREVGSFERLLVPGERSGRGELSSSAAIFPRAGERGQHGDGARGCAAVFGALHAVIHADRRRSCGGIFARQLLHLGRGHARPGGDALRRVFARALGKPIEAVRHLRDVGAVFEAVAHDHVHHSQRQGRIGAGADGDVPVGQGRGAGLVGVDDDEARAVAASLLHHGPEVNVVAVNVAAPRDDEFGQPEVFGRRAQLFAVDKVPGHAAGLGANGAVQLAGAEAMEEAAVHRSEAEHADSAGVAVGQNRFGTVLIADLCEPRGNGIECFVPGDALKGFLLLPSRQRTFGNAGLALERINEALGRVDPVEILGNFAAEKALGNRMRRVACHLDGAPLFVHRYQHGARVGAVVRADRVDDAKGGRHGGGHAVIVS